MPILTDSLEFALTALIGGGLGLLMVAIFYRPFRHGPTARIVHLLHAATLLLICGAFWAGALGFMADMRGQPWEVTYGLAIGFTGGAGWLWLRRWRRYRRYVRGLEASDASVNGAQRRTVPARLVVFSTTNGALHCGHGSGIGRSQVAKRQLGKRLQL